MILVTIGEKSIVRLNPEEVSQEEFLQTYIKDHPEVIPLDDYKDEARLLILGREYHFTSTADSGDVRQRFRNWANALAASG